MNDPKIISDKVIIRSPWIRIIERHVDFGGASAEQIYHCVDQSDYVTIIPVEAYLSLCHRQAGRGRRHEFDRETGGDAT